MEKSILIIGAGLSGLSSGCYGRMNGYSTTIFEMHDKAGGVCTGWKRKGYTIDGAMNWLIGTKRGTDYHRIWEELGAAGTWKIHNHDRMINMEDWEGRVHSIPCDIDRLEQWMIELSPEDEKAARELCRTVRSLGGFDMPVGKPQELYNWIDKAKMVKMIPFLSFMRKWSKHTLTDYALRFKHPLLREFLNMGQEEALSEMPALTMPMLLSWMHNREAGYVIGGALALVGSIERRYRELGGELHFNAKVEKILIENSRAVGIRLSDGSEHRGDVIVSTADGYATIFEMLEGRFLSDEIRSDYDHLKLFDPLVYIGLGVARTFDEIPPALNGFYFPVEEPVLLAGRERTHLNMLIYSYDPTLAEEGKTSIVVPLDTDYDYWKKLFGEPEKYREEKERIADTVIALLDKRFPGFAKQVEMRDVATPMTWERYTGNRRGSYEGWMMTGETFMKNMRKTLPGLDNFYMAGQWVNPGGGMPTAAISGNHTIQLICKKDGKRFSTSLP